MFLKFWYYLKGYVTISVSGFSIERFMNLAMNKGIYIWDVKYLDNEVQMKVSIKGYRMLKSCRRKTKCKTKIIDKYGFPFFTFRYRKRKIFFLGICFFVVSLYILSTYIWLIDIEGYNRVTYSQLMTFANSDGLKIGASRSSVNTTKIQEDILNRFSDISWVNIYITGTHATIQIKETIAPKNIVDKTTPCNIIAEKNGLISTIVTKSGKPLVKAGDVVQKGDVLVSGEIDLAEDSLGIIKSYVHADAEIMSKNYYDINFNVPYTYEEKDFSGKFEYNYRLSVFNDKFDFFPKKVNYLDYNRVSTYNQLNLGSQYPLPFVIIKDKYNEFSIVKKTRTEEECEELARKIVDTRIMKEFAFTSNIVDKTINISQTVSGIDVKCKVTTLENIGVQTTLTTTANPAAK